MVVGQVLEVVLLPDVAPGLLVLRHEHGQRNLQGRPCLDAKPLCHCRPDLHTRAMSLRTACSANRSAEKGIKQDLPQHHACRHAGQLFKANLLRDNGLHECNYAPAQSERHPLHQAYTFTTRQWYTNLKSLFWLVGQTSAILLPSDETHRSQKDMTVSAAIFDLRLLTCL